jgi:acetoin:2,6-dichlorophenolindophenol oxidoreductase subunit alpha
VSGKRSTNRGERLLALYGCMVLIRRAEERLSRLFADGAIPGFIHLSIGQEAVAAGIGAALLADDTIASTHRGHGHAIAKGVDLDRFFLELLARDEGLCRGRGGSMHVADLSVGMLGANGIVGAGLPIALGSALAHHTRALTSGGERRVAVAFFGDGALAEGVVHETLNLAALWRLPLLLVCENNGWAEFSPSSRQLAVGLQDLAGAFRIPARIVDGNDVEAVADAAAGIIEAVRNDGPHVLECMTTRVRGHFEGDPQKYRDDGETDGLAAKDPIARALDHLADLGLAEAAAKILREAETRVEAAVEIARGGTAPVFADAVAQVYAPTRGAT